jgi:hypothetical protein
MNLGVAQAILLNQKLVYGQAAPSSKITPPGALRAVLSNQTPKIVSKSVDDGSGYIRDVKVRFKKRLPKGKTSTTDDCSINAEPAYFEQSIPALAVRSYGMFFEWNYIQSLTQNALAIQNGGTPSVALAMEMWDSIQNCMNGLLADINADVLTSLYANRGWNQVSGNNTAQGVNFPLTGTSNNFGEGLTKLMMDMAMNEVDWSSSKLIGSGFSYAAWMQQMAGARGLNAAGLNTGALTHPEYFFDPQAATTWAANRFCIMENDSVGFINECLFRGMAKSGQKGDSEFGTFLIPALTDSQGNVLRTLELDFQVKHITCPTDLTILEDDAYPDAVAKGRGTQLNIIARFAPVYIPSTAYASDDRLVNVNGLFFYLGSQS